MKKYLRVLATVSVAVLLVSSNSIIYAQSDGTSTEGTTTFTADTEAPSDVENLKASAGDSEIILTWDSATDNVGVAGYKIYRGTASVQTENDSYDLPTVPVGNVNTYTVGSLTNSQTYYFSITAFDAAGNESVNYSIEANAKPETGLHAASLEDDGKPPQVKEVKTEDIITVLVVFSEPVKLPLENPGSAFKIEKSSDKSALAVQKAQLDSADEKGQTVKLTTAPQEENADYVLTAGIELQDNFGNPVMSGTSDTGAFKGSAKQAAEDGATEEAEEPIAPETTQDTSAPAISEGAADFNNRISVTFSEKIALPENPATQFTVTKKGSAQKLEIKNVSLSVDGSTVYITTAPQENIEYEVKTAGVKDLSGNILAASSNSVTVRGNASIKDLIPPENVTNLIARIKNAEQHIVELKWKASKNSAKDLADQLFYQSGGRYGKVYGNSTSMGSTTTTTDVENLEGGKWYTFKVTTKDETGNESTGAITTIYLPKTGPGMLAIGLTALLMGIYSKKKKRN